MVIECSGNIYGKFGVYQLTDFGTRKLSSCTRKPFKDHFSCQKVEFYSEADPADFTFGDIKMIESSVGNGNFDISQLDGQDDLSSNDSNEVLSSFHDPYPMFNGKRLKNNRGYLCYLNSIVNGCLSLTHFRKLIQFMEPTIKEYFNRVLDDKMKNPAV